MALDLPHEVVVFLNFIGVPYPDIDEDQVRALAGHVRTFADEVSGTHESATGTISDMSAVYQGQSYRALVASWAQLSSTHMERLDQLCRGVATALEIAAEVITAVKVAVLAELALLASAYTAAMAATVVTSGASAALSQGLALAARRLVRAMEEMLVAYILAEVLGKAIEPLEEAVSEMISGAVYGATADMLGVDPGGADVVLVDPDELRQYAQVLDNHADDIMKHAADFGAKVAALDFSTPVVSVAAPHDAGRTGTAGSTATSTRTGSPDTSPAASDPGQRNWIPGPARGADLPVDGAGGPSGNLPAQTAAGGTGPAVPAAATAPGTASAPSAAAPIAGSAIDPAPAAVASRPEAAENRAAAEPVRASASGAGSSGPVAAATDTGSLGPSEADAGQAAANGPATALGAGPAASGGAAHAAPGRDQPNPWNRPAAEAAGPAPRGAGPAPMAKSSSGRAAPPIRAGGPLAGSIQGRPATEPVATPTPWSKPSAPAAQQVPDRHAAVAARDTTPPPWVRSGSPAKSTRSEGESAAGAGESAAGAGESAAGAAESGSRRTEVEQVAVVSAPSRRDEGPPAGR